MTLETEAAETVETTEEPQPQLSRVDLELLAQSEKDAAERKNIKRALLAAVVFHAVALIVTFPELVAKPDERPQKVQEVFVVQQVRFQPPAPRRQEIPKRKTRRIPIPDPTPDDPEPIVIEELIDPEIDLPETDDALFGIPDAPPSAVAFGRGDVMQVGGGVTAPEKLHAPQPKYSEEARQGRVQGVVILQAIIDNVGQVSDVEVLKGLPLGLTDSAIETVEEWRFKPATQNGKPVAVYLNLLINFSLQ
ncbi:MAG: energy transducer TonB [bacterium]|nr:energy transducer TonB [bacterium]